MLSAIASPGEMPSGVVETSSAASGLPTSVKDVASCVGALKERRTPKRRNLQDDRVDSEEEIGPECLLLDESVEVLVRGGDQADVDLALAHIAEAPEFLLLMLSDGLKCRERLRAVDRSAPWNIAGSETALPDARASWKR